MSSNIQYSNFMVVWEKLLTPSLFDLDFLRAQHWKSFNISVLLSLKTTKVSHFWPMETL